MGIYHLYLQVRVKTQEGFGLAAVIEDMRIRGRKDRETNGWVCEDYVKVSFEFCSGSRRPSIFRNVFLSQLFIFHLDSLCI